MQTLGCMLMDEIKVQMSCKGIWTNPIVINTSVRTGFISRPEIEYPYRFYMAPPILQKNALIMVWNRLPTSSTCFLPFNDNYPTVRRNAISANDNDMWNSLTKIKLYKITPELVDIFMHLLTGQFLQCLRLRNKMKLRAVRSERKPRLPLKLWEWRRLVALIGQLEQEHLNWLWMWIIQKLQKRIWNLS